MTEPAPPSPATSLCTSCGLCCDGTVFRQARLRSGEVADPDFVTKATWIESEDRPTFLLPCTAFDGTCSVYGRRPAVCRSFRCKLLRGAEGGKVSWERAHELVRMTRRQRDALRGAIAEVLGATDRGNYIGKEMERVRETRRPDESDGEFRSRLGNVLVSHAALDLLLRKHFRLQREEPTQG